MVGASTTGHPVLSSYPIYCRQDTQLVVTPCLGSLLVTQLMFRGLFCYPSLFVDPTGYQQSCCLILAVVTPSLFVDTHPLSKTPIVCNSLFGGLAGYPSNVYC